MNIDFFKDLMQVLKDLIARQPDEDADEESPRGASGDVRYRLECIVTAFELLTGQGAYLATRARASTPPRHPPHRTADTARLHFPQGRR